MVEQLPVIKVFYHPSGIPDDINKVAGERYFFLEKPRLIFESLQREGLNFEHCMYQPYTWEDFKLCHSSEYVDAVRTGSPIELAESCAIPWSEEYTATLPYITSSLHKALVSAISTDRPAMSLSFAFHHAKYAQGGSLCPFNDINIAAEKIHSELGLRGLVIDCDYHYGNGTDDIIANCNQGEYLRNLSMGRYFSRSYFMHNEYLISLKEKLTAEFKQDFLQYVIYIASADVYERDPMAKRGPLSLKEIVKRDELVFRMVKEKGVPLVFCLGGGYHSVETNSLIHVNTFKACSNIFFNTVHRYNFSL